MEVHVDHVQVHEAAARPAGPHAHVQVLHPMGRQCEDALGVHLQKQSGEWDEGFWHPPPRDPLLGDHLLGAHAAERADLRQGRATAVTACSPPCLTPCVGQVPSHVAATPLALTEPPAGARPARWAVRLAALTQT